MILEKSENSVAKLSGARICGMNQVALAANLQRNGDSGRNPARTGIHGLRLRTVHIVHRVERNIRRDNVDSVRFTVSESGDVLFDRNHRTPLVAVAVRPDSVIGAGGVLIAARRRNKHNPDLRRGRYGPDH